VPRPARPGRPTKICKRSLRPPRRRHHEVKQGPGWRLEQREPAAATWTLPSGRRPTAAPGPYPG